MVEVRVTVGGQDPAVYFRDLRGRFAARAQAAVVTGHVPTPEDRQAIIDNMVWNGGGGGFARAEYIVGSDLPYASHWIEEGWRDDPRFGTVRVLYRQPGDAQFLEAGAQAINSYVTADLGQYPPPIGALLDPYVAAMADRAAVAMRAQLQKVVYSTPPIRKATYTQTVTNPRTGATRTRTVSRTYRWTRTHALYNSIRTHRVS